MMTQGRRRKQFHRLLLALCFKGLFVLQKTLIEGVASRRSQLFWSQLSATTYHLSHKLGRLHGNRNDLHVGQRRKKLYFILVPGPREELENVKPSYFDYEIQFNEIYFAI